MKKIKICLLLFLSMAVVFSGCAGINGYFKTATTDLSLATFYNNNYLKGISVFQNAADDSSVIYTESDRIAYKNHVKAIYELLPEERCLLAATDYLYEINDPQNPSAQKVKLKPYEFRIVLKSELELMSETNVYAENFSNIKAVVLLERTEKTTSMELNTYLFYMDASTSYEVADLINNKQNAHYGFTFVQTNYNVQTKTFSLKYNTNSVASATFNQEKGCLTYSMTTYLGQTNSQTKLDKSIYQYSDTTVAIRILTEQGVGGQNTLSVYEQMTSQFYNRAKVGEVKDKVNMLSLETMPDDRLAAVNSSDNKGYLLTYDARDDEQVARIICENYGLN